MKQALFDSAYYKILELRDKLRFLYENPLSLDADNLNSIINMHAETVCLRTLASWGRNAGTKVLQESILAHEKLITRIGKEPHNAVERIQIELSFAMIARAKKAISE